MGRQRIDVTAQSLAQPAAIYALLTDGASWPAWSPIESFELERTGEDGREGVGAVRVLRSGRTVGRDTIAELVTDRRLAYTHESSLPIRDYRGQIDLTPHGAGTEVRWRASFEPKLPGTGPVLRRALQGFLRKCADGVAEHAAASGQRVPASG